MFNHFEGRVSPSGASGKQKQRTIGVWYNGIVLRPERYTLITFDLQKQRKENKWEVLGAEHAWNTVSFCQDESSGPLSSIMLL
jgi:hypothetical protein